MAQWLAGATFFSRRVQLPALHLTELFFHSVEYTHSLVERSRVAPLGRSFVVNLFVASVIGVIADGRDHCFDFGRNALPARLQRTACQGDDSNYYYDNSTHYSRLLYLNPRRRLRRKRERYFRLRGKQGRALLQRHFRGDFCEIRIVGTLGQMREHDMPGDTVKAVLKPFRHIFVRYVPEPRQDALL